MVKDDLHLKMSDEDSDPTVISASEEDDPTDFCLRGGWSDWPCVSKKVRQRNMANNIHCLSMDVNQMGGINVYVVEKIPTCPVFKIPCIQYIQYKCNINLYTPTNFFQMTMKCFNLRGSTSSQQRLVNGRIRLSLV